MVRCCIVFLGIMMGGIAPAFSQPQILNVWEGEIPGAIPNAHDTKNRGRADQPASVYTRVTDPTIAVYLPPKDIATQTAVLICPGGGYQQVSYESEGVRVAAFLNTLGVAGVVLKYRLPSDLTMKNKAIAPLQDAQEAMRILRRNAKKWNIDPNKIGVMGFSAGGHLASTLSTHYLDEVYSRQDTVSCRPDFCILVYPVISMQVLPHRGSRERLLGTSADPQRLAFYSSDLQVNSNTPPTFLVHSADDTAVPMSHSLQYYLAMQKHKVDGELHIYQGGGHGYGLGEKGGSEASWSYALAQWLKMRGLIF